MLGFRHFTIAFCFLLILGLRADDFVCPQTKISVSDGATGAIPQGATSMVQFPKESSCVFKFDVPPGYAIRMELNSAYDASLEDYVRFDTFFVSSGLKQVEWYMGPELLVSYYSETGNLTFFATYSYVVVSGYSQVVKNTGDYFNSTLEANKFYTVQATQGDTATYSLASRNTGSTDNTIREVFIFDGGDIVNAQYIGRLSQNTKGYQSSTSSLTFLNLYGTPSDTVILGNDYSKIAALPQYNVILMDPNTLNTGVFQNTNANQNDSYYTFICDGFYGFYIEALTFPSDSNGYVEVQGMTPTQNLPPVLRYSPSTTLNQSLPQLVTSPLATFHIYRSPANFAVSTSAHTGYYNAADGKIRTVSSPVLWNPNADAPFDYTFSHTVKMFNFSITLQSVNIVGDGDVFTVEVATTDGDINLLNTYKNVSLTNVAISGIGHYLNLKYSGGKSSAVVVNFDEIEVGVSTSTVSSTSTTTTSTSTTTPRPSTSTPTTTTSGSGSSTSAPSTAPTTAGPIAPVTSASTSSGTSGSIATATNAPTTPPVQTTTKGTSLFNVYLPILTAVCICIIRSCH